MAEPTNTDRKAFGVACRNDGTLRTMPFVMALPFDVLEAIGRAGFYSAWHLLYFIACAFRAFTGFMVLAGIVMLPLAFAVFVNPSAAPMPWWFFLLSALAMFAFAIGYNMILAWSAPPGAEDAFDRYRTRTRKL